MKKHEKDGGMYDAAIIGAGPAGASLARLVGAKRRILLIDKRRIPETPPIETAPKCCGGLLAPDAQRMIARFGLGLPKSVLVEPQLFVVRAMDAVTRRERFYQRFYLNMDRLAFERWLVSMVPASVDALFGWRFLSFRPAEEGFEIELDRDGEKRVVRTRILVGADGASSQVRAQALPHVFDSSVYFAVQEWVETEATLPYFSAIFDPELTDYYGWTIPKGKHLLIGIALRPKDDAANKFDRFKVRLQDWGLQCGRTVRREGAFLIRPHRFQPVAVAQRGVVLMGEAGGWISPSSAEGLSYAFRSALALADALDAGIDGFERRYARNMRPVARILLVKHFKSRLIFNPRCRQLALRSGWSSLAVRR